MTRKLVVGVDGCATGWVAVALSGTSVAVSIHGSFADVVAAFGKAAVIGVDMPIGLVASGWRQADLAGRKHLAAHRKSSSIFLVPPRAVIAVTTYEAACRLSRKLAGAAISRQSFGLFAKIREVEEHIADARVIEVHPEVSFTLMGGAALPSKKTYGGAMARRLLLAGQGIAVPDRFAGDDRAGVDDVLDAAAVAWSARRFARGESIALPADATDRDGARVLQIIG